jgi:hypothetical protein
VIHQLSDPMDVDPSWAVFFFVPALLVGGSTGRRDDARRPVSRRLNAIITVFLAS